MQALRASRKTSEAFRCRPPSREVPLSCTRRRSSARASSRKPPASIRSSAGLYVEGFAPLQQGTTKGRLAAFSDALGARPGDRGIGCGNRSAGTCGRSIPRWLGADGARALEAAIALAPDRAEPHRCSAAHLADRRVRRRRSPSLKPLSALNPPTNARGSPWRTRSSRAGNSGGRSRRCASTHDPSRLGPRALRAGARLSAPGYSREALREFHDGPHVQAAAGPERHLPDHGRPEAARAELRCARSTRSRERVDLVPNDADAHQDLGATYLRQGRHDEALAEFTAALMLNPARTEAYAAIGQVHLRDGRYHEAADAARHAVELNAAHKEARYVLATSLIRLGKAG